MPRVLRLAILAVFALFIATGLIIARRALGPSPVSAEGTPVPAGSKGAAAPVSPHADSGRPNIADLLSIPPFALVDHNGRRFTRDDLLGHITILDVVFTNCPLVCPTMTEKMHAMAEALADTPVRFVSISIDPNHDSPAALREYRKLHEITGEAADRWVHLTSPDGSSDYIKPIVQDGLKCALEEDRTLPIKASDGSDMFNILHPTWFFLLDARGGDGKSIKVVDLYQSSSDDEMARLERDARKLAK